MNQQAISLRGHTALIDGKLTLITRAVLVAASTIAIITLHETLHLLVGRLAGIPAVFTGLTSAGLPKGIDAHQYGPTQLTLMNGIAPLLTVVFGFVVYYALAKRLRARQTACDPGTSAVFLCVVGDLRHPLSRLAIDAGH